MLHLDYYLNRLSKIVLYPTEILFRLGRSHGLRQTWWLFFLKFLSFFGLVKFEEQIDEEKIFNRSLIFLKEAKRRGIPVKAVKLFGQYKNEFVFQHQGQEHYFEGVPGVQGRSREFALDDKFFAKQKLAAAGLPVVQGKLFTDPREAQDYGEELGFPLVVKPNHASLSHHATYPVLNQSELTEAIKIAKQYQPEFIVERFLNGKFYRATVVGNSVFVCEKARPNVVGDSRSSIRDLVQQKNNDPRRGELEQWNSTLHKITIDEELKRYLEKQGLSLNSVPVNEERVELKDKFTLSSGCDIINQTQETHPENLAMFAQVAELMRVNLVGIDLIAKDIAKPHYEQGAGIIELNSLPFLDMHQNPSHGKPEPVAKVVWDFVEERLKNAFDREEKFQ